MSGDGGERPAHPRAARRELHALARAALDRYDVVPRSVRLVGVATNATYLVVDERGRRFALRVSIPGPTDHTELEARSEISWLQDLAAARDLSVAAPVRTSTGDTLVVLPGQDAAASRRCVLFDWLPGRLLAAASARTGWFATGVLAARLHRHGAAFRPPAWFSVPRYDRVLPFDEPALLLDRGPHRPRARLDVFRRATAAVEEAIARLSASGEPARVLHGDLHQWNVKIHEGRAAAFDFEDLVLGWPVEDVATTLYYARHDPHPRAASEAFRRGYESVARWPAHDAAELATFVMGRALVISNTALQLDLDDEIVAGVLARAEQLAHDTVGGLTVAQTTPPAA